MEDFSKLEIDIFFKNFEDSQLIDYASKNINSDIHLESVELASGSISKLLDNIDNDRSNEFKKLVNIFYNDNLASIEKFLSRVNKIKAKNK